MGVRLTHLMSLGDANAALTHSPAVFLRSLSRSTQTPNRFLPLSLQSCGATAFCRTSGCETLLAVCLRMCVLLLLHGRQTKKLRRHSSLALILVLSHAAHARRARASNGKLTRVPACGGKKGKIVYALRQNAAAARRLAGFCSCWKYQFFLPTSEVQKMFSSLEVPI